MSNVGTDQKKRILQTKILQAPLAIQSMRKTIIENANFLIEEMRAYDFSEVSEIIRVCTALGIKRAYLRGLQHEIANEGDIDKYLYRFNMLGTLPFQDQVEPEGSKSVALVLVEDSYVNKTTVAYALIGNYEASDSVTALINSLFPVNLTGSPAPVFVGSTPMTSITVNGVDLNSTPNFTAPSFFTDFTGGVFRITEPKSGSGAISDIRGSVETYIAGAATSTYIQKDDGPSGSSLANKINDIYVTDFKAVAGQGGKLFWKKGGNFAKRAFNYYVDSPNRLTQSVLVQATTMDGDAYVKVNGTQIEFETKVVGGRSVNEFSLPTTAFIPKYRQEGYDVDLPWLPYMTCDMLFNIPDPETCISTTDITPGSLEKPDLNMLVPYGSNQFPYMSPNGGFPYIKDINPRPFRVRMVMDGSPVDGEDVIAQNRFQLTGYTQMDPGDPGDGTLELPVDGDGNPTFTPGPGQDPGPGDTVIFDGNTDFVLITGDDPDLLYIDRDAVEKIYGPLDNLFNNLLADNNGILYSGPVMYQRDPIQGTNTIFTKELSKGNVIELVFPQRLSGGNFFLMGTDKMYYVGTYFHSRYHDNIRVIIDDIEYTIIQDTGSPYTTEQELTYHGWSFNYTASFTIQNKRIIKTELTHLFDQITQTVNLYTHPSRSSIAEVEFSNQNAEWVASRFEVGDVIVIDTVYYRFQSISGNRLKGVFRVDGAAINAGKNGATLTRDLKVSRTSHDGLVGYLPEFRIYYKVKEEVTSDTTIEISPAYSYNESFEGVINRVGFNFESKSPTPDLIESGFDTEGVAQLRIFNSATNAYQEDSQVFYLPEASTERIIKYEAPDFSKTPANVSVKPVVPIATAMSKFFSKDSKAYNFTNFDTFLTSLGINYGKLVYSEHFEKIDTLLSEKHTGQLSFTDGTDPYILLETLMPSSATSGTFAPMPNGFVEGDILTIRRMPEDLHYINDDPFGYCVSHRESSYLNEYDYKHCGLGIQVEEVTEPHRFKILKNGLSGLSFADKFFHSYDIDPDNYLTATNGDAVQYWAKYFKPVFMDGTTNANGILYATSTDVRTLGFTGKAPTGSLYEYNYLQDKETIQHYIGATPVSIESTTDHCVKLVGQTESEDGTFILSLDIPLTKPPNLLDAFFLRNAEFDYIELD